MTTRFESRFDDTYEGEIPASVDEAALRRMETVARVLDEFVRIPGTNVTVGLDPILGVVPVAGDLVGAGISAYIVLESANLGVSYPTLLRMIANVGVDAAIGSIPVVGTVFDAFWKVNRRNVRHALTDLAENVAETDETPVDVPVRTE